MVDISNLSKTVSALEQNPDIIRHLVSSGAVKPNEAAQLDLSNPPSISSVSSNSNPAPWQRVSPSSPYLDVGQNMPMFGASMPINDKLSVFAAATQQSMSGIVTNIVGINIAPPRYELSNGSSLGIEGTVGQVHYSSLSGNQAPQGGVNATLIAGYQEHPTHGLGVGLTFRQESAGRGDNSSLLIGGTYRF